MQTATSPSRTIYGTTLLGLLVVACFAGSHYLRKWHAREEAPPADPDTLQRIIALSPSSAETLRALGLHDRIIAVGRHYKPAPGDPELPVVGGYLDLDYEVVVSLRPDCILLLEAQRQLVVKLDQLGIRTVIVDHASIDGILQSITTLGNTFGRSAKAGELVRKMEARIEAVSVRASESGRKPRVLVCIERDTSAERPDRVVAAGTAGYHQELITMCGGVNAYQGSIPFPALSRENLITLDPDIIIDLIREDAWLQLGKDALVSQWDACPELSAVRHEQVVLIHGNRHMVPGPDFIDTLELFAEAIVPTR